MFEYCVQTNTGIFFALLRLHSKPKNQSLCTSGSGIVGYYPAFAEAFAINSLIVVPADRPAEKIDIGDSQTIRQKMFFANHSLFSDSREYFQ
jgi:2-succinyl-5-enolpyruvyl-6-hydroxy-3-cyclohexene-1-carboxylate synthase